MERWSYIKLPKKGAAPDNSHTVVPSLDDGPLIQPLSWITGQELIILIATEAHWTRTTLGREVQTSLDQTVSFI